MLINWNNGTGCSEKCQELIQSAKTFIGVFIEQAMLGSKISPPSGIFLIKNRLSYEDAISIEESIPSKETKRILTAAELPSKVFITPRNNPEREQAYSELSESDRTAVFNLERDYMLGRITRQDIAKMKQEGNETMTYAQYKKIMDNDCKGHLQELSQFSKENRELYRQYSDRYEREREAKHLIFQLWLNSDEQGRLMVSMPEGIPDRRIY